MKILIALLLPVCMFTAYGFANPSSKPVTYFFSADNPNIQYTGRIDFSDRLKPRLWAPGVYITAKFTGSSCSFIMNDEIHDGNHNYMEVVIDDAHFSRIQTVHKRDTIQAAEGLADGEHTITICKDTESGIGYLEFIGFTCEALLPMPAKPARKIEFIGNSITCGTGSDLSKIACNMGKWYDQHNAYMSYGPTTARALQAQWQLSAVSGIGLIHSCCAMKIAMPQVFDKINMRDDSLAWDFSQYQPDVVTICLGQNDGILDSVVFCRAYILFIQKIRAYYPGTRIVCITSPMGDEKLTGVLKHYLTATVSFVKDHGDQKVYAYFFKKRYHQGCGGHPDLDEHRQIAGELAAYIKSMMEW